MVGLLGAGYRDVVEVSEAVVRTDFPSGFLAELSEDPVDRDSALRFDDTWVDRRLQSVSLPIPDGCSRPRSCLPS